MKNGASAKALDFRCSHEPLIERQQRKLRELDSQ
jgi:hypothetical protein